MKNSDAEPRNWDERGARQPQQDRSTRTRTAQLDAAQQLLESDGLEGVTIAKVAELAGVSVGTPYHHFKNKKALVYAVVDRHMTEAVQNAESDLHPQHWTDVPLLDILEGYLHQALDSGRKFNGTHRALKQLTLEDSDIAIRTAQAHRAVHRPVMSLLQTRAAEVPHSQPEIALAVVLEVLWSCVDQRLSHDSPGTSDRITNLSDQDFITELVQLAKSYLQIT